MVWSVFQIRSQRVHPRRARSMARLADARKRKIHGAKYMVVRLAAHGKALARSSSVKAQAQNVRGAIVPFPLRSVLSFGKRENRIPSSEESEPFGMVAYISYSVRWSKLAQPPPRT
jgi:hypothetical protein